MTLEWFVILSSSLEALSHTGYNLEVTALVEQQVNKQIHTFRSSSLVDFTKKGSA